MKLLTVIGARPQFIKAAVLSRLIQSCLYIHEILVHTGQHFDPNMSDVFFQELELPQPHYHLGIGGGTHGQNTGRMIEAIETVLLKERPDWLLVYGDTDSTLAGALAAVKLHIPVAHVEAGLRSFNRRMPEEINRVLTDHASDLLFAPTPQAVNNLRREGIPDERIALVGDIMYDAALYYAEKAQRRSQILQRLGLQPKTYILATIHRAENTDDPQRLHTILEAFCRVHRQIPVIFPVHPRTYKAAQRHNLLPLLQALHTLPPVSYLDMILLEKNANLIVTDSGGVQKEAYFHRVPCVTLREETEWTELVETGWNLVVPPREVDTIVSSILNRLGHQGKPVQLYGDGRTAEKILHRLLQERP